MTVPTDFADLAWQNAIVTLEKYEGDVLVETITLQNGEIINIERGEQ
jgi:hypothetical protein